MSRNSLFVFAFYIAAALCMPQHMSAQSGNVFRQEGMASWYGPEFDGRPTASGEIFNSTLFTAAHPSLPFGTFLLVTNKQNNRQITVKVNDRGPFVAGRVIDLSKAAAEHLDMIAAGTVPVIVETMPTTYLQPAAEAPSPITVTPAAPGPGFGPEPVPAPAVSAAPPVEQPGSYPYPPVTVNIYSTPQPQAQPEYEIPQAQPQFDPYAQPWLQSIPQPYPPSPYDYQPNPFSTEMTPPPPVYAPPPPPPPLAYTPPPPPPPAYAPPPPPAYAPPLPPPTSGLKLLPSINPLPGRIYRLQVGSYKIPRHAVDAFDKLKAAGLNPSYEPNGEFYRVVLTRVPGTEVPSVVAKLEYAGFREALIKEER